MYMVLLTISGHHSGTCASRTADAKLIQNFPGNTPRVDVHPMRRHNHGPHYLMTLRFSAAISLGKANVLGDFRGY
jgi:hypothetical protein